MTELDFDELDKAVSDLMYEGGAADATDETSQVPLQPQPAPAVPQSIPDPQQAEAPKQTPLAMKRRGRFMDVMAPAGAKQISNDITVKRQGITVTEPEASTDSKVPQVQIDNPLIDNAHLDNQAAQATSNDQAVTDDTGDLVAPHDGATDYASNPAPVTEWPEPEEISTSDTDEHSVVQPDIDEVTPTTVPVTVPYSQSASDEADITVTTPEPADAVSVNPPQPDAVEEQLSTVVTPDDMPQDTVLEPKRDEPTPLPESVMTSPFLPDAKVEKRPLGGDAASDTAESATMNAAQELPREYNSELMSLETNLAANKSESSAPEGAVPEPAAAAAVDTAAPLAAATVAATTAGAIFDTETYHAPLKQPAKSKSGWLTVIWILVLLIIGSVAGAAYYYFTTQQ